MYVTVCKVFINLFQILVTYPDVLEQCFIYSVIIMDDILTFQLTIKLINPEKSTRLGL